jgi:hypothetical protein
MEEPIRPRKKLATVAEFPSGPGTCGKGKRKSTAAFMAEKKRNALEYDADLKAYRSAKKKFDAAQQQQKKTNKAL